MNRPACLMFLFIFCAASAFSFSFEPITAEFDPSGPGSTQTFKVTNTTASPIAVRITVLKRVMNFDGSDTLLDAPDDFKVFPSRMALKVNGTQIVRVQWRGTSKPEREYAYRIIAEQLPVDFAQTQREGGVINVQFRYVGSLYVVPGPMKPELTIRSVENLTDADGKKKLAIVMENVSGVHAILEAPQVTLDVKDSSGTVIQSVALENESLKGLAGENILAGCTRRFLIASPPDLADGILHAGIRFQFR